ncbi:hypothetical protein RBU61_00020 [Tissierella sp. MB52-C2]|uniref:hypothetical protein n=1 Tax=Tissierella sp. MB52-C2 TaxID=3070999 RepID=UPI00280BAD92|nr:hypothetical protein [Tissierella sp. MB52-C2]WMM25079.1 hypothetical protein RBU61_00020 [Tissierella sp. MB52-C2]
MKDINNLDGIIDSSELLKEHKFYLEQIKDREQKYMLSEKEEVLISKMSNTEFFCMVKSSNMVYHQPPLW